MVEAKSLVQHTLVSQHHASCGEEGGEEGDKKCQLKRRCRSVSGRGRLAHAVTVRRGPRGARPEDPAPRPTCTNTLLDSQVVRMRCGKEVGRARPPPTAGCRFFASVGVPTSGNGATCGVRPGPSPAAATCVLPRYTLVTVTKLPWGGAGSCASAAHASPATCRQTTVSLLSPGPLGWARPSPPHCVRQPRGKDNTTCLRGREVPARRDGVAGGVRSASPPHRHVRTPSAPPHAQNTPRGACRRWGLTKCVCRE